MSALDHIPAITKAAIDAIQAKESPNPIDNSHDVAMKQARIALGDAIRLAYLPNPTDAYNQLLPALRLDATKKPKLRERHVGGTETLLPLTVANVNRVLDPNGADAQYVRELHKPRIPTAAEIEAKRVEQERLELQFRWNDLPPVSRELLKLVDVADKDHRKLLLALARVFSMKPSDFISTAGEPAACAASFFGLERK